MLGIDLLDFWRGRMTARRLDLLISHLPVESALAIALNPDNAELTRWRAGDYILADLVDATMAAHFKNPRPYPRPLDVIIQRRRDDARLELLIAQRDRANAQYRNEGGTP